jgi:hypothetical protein
VARDGTMSAGDFTAWAEVGPGRTGDGVSRRRVTSGLGQPVWVLTEAPVGAERAL